MQMFLNVRIAEIMFNNVHHLRRTQLNLNCRLRNRSNFIFHYHYNRLETFRFEDKDDWEDEIKLILKEKIPRQAPLNVFLTRTVGTLIFIEGA